MQEVTSFDVAQAGASYSAVAGIIAGFAFAVLVWLVERLRPDEDHAPDNEGLIRALVFLGISFLGNMLVAFFWALVSGQMNLEANRTTILSFIAALNFSLFAPLTMEALVFVVATGGSQRAIELFRRIFFLSVIISLAFQWSSTVGLLEAQARNSSIVQNNGQFFMIMIPLTILIVLSSASINHVLSGRWKPLDSDNSFSIFIWVWLLTILVSALLFGVVSVSQPTTELPLWLVGLLNIGWAVALGWASLFLPKIAS
jgi:hypothetical protein